MKYLMSKQIALQENKAMKQLLEEVLKEIDKQFTEWIERNY